MRQLSQLVIDFIVFWGPKKENKESLLKNLANIHVLYVDEKRSS
jgi:hypothetical protein